MLGVWLAFGLPVARKFYNTSKSVKNVYAIQDSLIWHGKELIVGASTVEGYPLTTYGDKNRDNIVFVDGMIYGMSESIKKSKLLALCNLMTLRSSADLKEGCRKFLEEMDGEFVIVMINKSSGSFAIFNDSLGRLPFYYTKKNNCLVAARSIQNVVKTQEQIQLNNAAVACQLLLEYPITEDTMFRGIKNWPEGNLLCYDGHTTSALQPLCKWRFETFKAQKSFEPTVERLTNSLIKACEDRISAQDRRNTVISLSGGFDSRIVAAAAKSIESKVTAITRTTRTERNEIEIAAEIGKSLNIHPHFFIPVHHVPTDIIIRTAILSDGALDISLAHSLAFLLMAKEKIGHNMLLLTGDGGDKTLAPLALNRKTRSVEELADYFLEPCLKGEINLVQELLCVKYQDIKEALMNTLNNLPEQDMSGKFRSFIIRQRVRCWLTKGEDRNRQVFWSTTPFYSPDFFKTSISCPIEWKENYKLSRAVLKMLNGHCSDIPRAGHVGASFKQRSLMYAYKVLTSQKRLLKMYRFRKEHTKLQLNRCLPHGLRTHLYEIMADDHLFLDATNDRVLDCLNTPPTIRLRNRLISILIYLAYIRNQKVVSCNES